MNLLKVLEVISEDELTRSMVVIENCHDVDEDYDELYVVYDPDKSRADMVSMINDTKNELMGMMLELLDKNPAQLWNMMKPGGQTYTELLVEQCGGKDEFLAKYAPDKFNIGIREEAPAEAVVSDEFTESVGAEEPVPSQNFESVPAQEMPAFPGVPTDVLDKLQSVLKDLQGISQPIADASRALVDANTRLSNKEQIISEKYCAIEKVLNPDGTFKGFTTENFVEIAAAIKKIDDTINLGNLAEDEILTADEVKKSEKFLEDFDPYIFKDFILSVVNKAETDAERVYVSGLVGRFLDYVEENV